MDRIRSLTATVLTLLVVLSLPVAAWAQQYPPPPRNVTIIIVNPALTVTIHGTNYGPGTDVVITRSAPPSSTPAGRPQVLGKATVAPDGTFDAQFAAPDGVEVADIEVQAAGTAADGTAKTDDFVLTSQRMLQTDELATGGLRIWHVLLLGGGAIVLVGAVTRRSLHARATTPVA